MSLGDAIRTSIANEINRARERRASYSLHQSPNEAIPVHPNDVIDVEFIWDEGESCTNEDYDLSPRLPSMEVQATIAAVGRRRQEYCTVSGGIVLNALLKALVVMDL